MSSDFTAQQDAIKAWFRRGTGLTQALMHNEPRPHVRPQWGDIEIKASTREGTDSVQYVEVGGQRLPHVRCTRALDILLAVESFSQDPAKIGLVLLEQLRASSMIPGMQAILRAADLAYITDAEIVQADYQIMDPEARFISRYEMRSRFRWGFIVDPSTTPDDSLGTIERVESAFEGQPGDVERDMVAERL